MCSSLLSRYRLTVVEVSKAFFYPVSISEQTTSSLVNYKVFQAIQCILRKFGTSEQAHVVVSVI